MNVIQSEAECSISKATDEEANHVAAEPASFNGEPFSDHDKEPSTRLRDELSCLVEFMDKDMKTIFDVQKDLKDGTRKTIEFDCLWQLFKPGEFVVTSGNQKRAYVVLLVDVHCTKAHHRYLKTAFCLHARERRKRHI
ncbi:hypothetical protein ABVK25_001853 [Lepraria finkii]|uniref:DUF7025 domain-containing protein n=1 Tax=Lepraria finkii TaxID=1340010 RepID=A0ABR4BK96_9LECA